MTRALCHQHTGSSHCLDLLLGPSAEELGLDNHGLLGQLAFAQNFVVTLEEKGRKVRKMESTTSAAANHTVVMHTARRHTLTGTSLSIGEVITTINPGQSSLAVFRHVNMLTEGNAFPSKIFIW